MEKQKLSFLNHHNIPCTIVKYFINLKNSQNSLGGKDKAICPPSLIVTGRAIISTWIVRLQILCCEALCYTTTSFSFIMKSIGSMGKSIYIQIFIIKLFQSLGLL